MTLIASFRRLMNRVFLKTAPTIEPTPPQPELDQEPEAPAGMDLEIWEAFQATMQTQASPEPLFGDSNFPPAWINGDMQESLIRKFYPAIEFEAQIYEFHPELLIRPVPNLDLAIAFPDHPCESFRLRTNSLGMRNDLDASIGPPDVRVLLTGASNAQGVVGNDESASGILKAHLQRERPGQSVEVLNAACGTYNFYNVLAVLNTYSNLQPDVFVVLAYTGNDFFGGIKQWRLFRGLGPAAGGRYSGSPLLESEFPFERNLLGLEIGQVAYTLNNPGDENLALNVACSASVEIERVCRERNIQVIFACLPPPLVGQPKRMAQTRSRVEELLSLPPDAIDVSDRIGDRWVAFLKEQYIPICDLRPIFRNTEEPLYYPNDGHINPRAHLLVGEALGPLVQKALGRQGP